MITSTGSGGLNMEFSLLVTNVPHKNATITQDLKLIYQKAKVKTDSCAPDHIWLSGSNLERDYSREKPAREEARQRCVFKTLASASCHRKS